MSEYGPGLPGMVGEFSGVGQYGHHHADIRGWFRCLGSGKDAERPASRLESWP